MKEKVCNKGWFRYFFINVPIGFVLLMILGVLGVCWLSSYVDVPIYETIEVIVYEDADGKYIRIPEQIELVSTPIYLYQTRDKYMEKIDDYHVKAQNHAVYIENTDFVADDVVYVDIEIQRVTLLSYIFR